ncbi:MAG: hypothetical protein JW809_19255 [Pirellulales bacterium]|nr:hypothetical protein [Pirellulales bacterium]
MLDLASIFGSPPPQPPAVVEPVVVVEPKLVVEPVCRCGSTTWRDVPIHNGQSVRRDCARCGRFLDFPRWYGRVRTVAPDKQAGGDD